MVYLQCSLLCYRYISFILQGNLFPWKNHQCCAMGHVCWQIWKEAMHCDQHPLSVGNIIFSPIVGAYTSHSIKQDWSKSYFDSPFRVVFNTLFGLSTTYWMAIVTRGLLGLLCGILGPIKVWLAQWAYWYLGPTFSWLLASVFYRPMLQKSAGKSTKL